MQKRGVRTKSQEGAPAGGQGGCEPRIEVSKLGA